jgi:hypothetical protein
MTPNNTKLVNPKINTLKFYKNESFSYISRVNFLPEMKSIFNYLELKVHILELKEENRLLKAHNTRLKLEIVILKGEQITVNPQNIMSDYGYALAQWGPYDYPSSEDFDILITEKSKVIFEAVEEVGQ